MVFINPDTLCMGLECPILHGLSKHLLLECYLRLRDGIFMAPDPSRWALLWLQRWAPAAATASVALWWSSHAHLPLDSLVLRVRSALNSLVTMHRDSCRPPDRDMLSAAQAAGTGQRGSHSPRMVAGAIRQHVRSPTPGVLFQATRIVGTSIH